MATTRPSGRVLRDRRIRLNIHLDSRSRSSAKASAPLSEGRLFRCVCRAGKTWGNGVTERVVWHVVKDCARQAAIKNLAPHDLRPTCARLCRDAGGELDQIQFLLGGEFVFIIPSQKNRRQRLALAGTGSYIALGAVPRAARHTSNAARPLPLPRKKGATVCGPEVYGERWPRLIRMVDLCGGWRTNRGRLSTTRKRTSECQRR
jgi:hypothetical protein